MMENCRQQTSPLASPRRRSGRARVRALPFQFESEDEPEGIGDVEDEFDTVDIGDVIRETRGGRVPAVDTDGL